MLPCQNTNLLPRTVSVFWLALIVTQAIRLKERAGSRHQRLTLCERAHHKGTSNILKIKYSYKTKKNGFLK